MYIRSLLGPLPGGRPRGGGWAQDFPQPQKRKQKERLATGTNNRNRTSPRSSVANVPVASQPAVGTLFFAPRQIERIVIGSDFPSLRTTIRLSRGAEHFGAQKSLRFSPTSKNCNPNRRKIATHGALSEVSDGPQHPLDKTN